MAEQWSTMMAGSILAKAATLRPGSVPNNITEDVITAWAEAVEMMDRPKITDLWKEAVTRWSVDEPNDRMFTPYSLRMAVDRTLDRWHHDPKLHDELEWYQYRNVKAKVDAGRLPAGTEDGYLPKSAEQAREVVPPTADQQRSIDQFRARRVAQ